MRLLLFIGQLIAYLTLMHGAPQLEADEGTYTRYRMADSCTIELLLTAPDTIVTVETVCAPICSSIARVYYINKEEQKKTWEYVREIMSPYPHAVFPEAHIESGRLVWQDNTYLMLDAEEQERLGHTASSE